MSNYNSLKTTINANVKQNGNQEITGQILNSVLNQMVTTLGTGYQFAGVATTATNPGSPDAKVFYIANGKGTYTNFGGISVTEDDVVVLYWDSSWHKVSTGIASQEKLSDLDGIVNGSEGGVVVDVIEISETGKYISAWGAVTESANTMYSKPIPVRAGVTYTFLGRGYSTSVGMISKTDAQGTSYQVVARSADSTLREYTYTPSEDGYIAVSCYTTYEYGLSHEEEPVEGLVSKVDGLEEQVEDIERITDGHSDKIVLPFEIAEYGSYFGYNSSSVSIRESDGTYYSKPIPVRKGVTYTLFGRGYGGNFWMIISCDEDGNNMRGRVRSSSPNDAKEYQYTPVEDGYIAVCGYESFPHEVSYLDVVKGVDERIEDLEDRLDSIPVWMPKDYAFCGIPSVGIIGDSLASGVGKDTDINLYQYAWWQTLKRDSGMEYRYFCAGGLTTRSWFTNSVGYPKASLSENRCHAYIIGLMVNDQYRFGLDYLGTIEDINDTDFTQNADTFFGNYGKIIQSLTSLTPNAKFFLLTAPRDSVNYAAYNDAVRAIANKFSNCYLIDLRRDYFEEYSNGYISTQLYATGAHYSAAGYVAMAKILEKEISKIMTEHPGDFLNIQYALE